MPLTAQVQKRNGVPTLLVNGKAVPPLMLFVNLVGEKREAGLSTVRRAARAGVHIVSFVEHYLPWAPPGETPTYRPYEEQIEAILRENPRALLLPRFGLTNTPEWWNKEHADERMLYDNGERGQASVASSIWRQEAGEALRGLVRYLESRYGNHIIGYHPCGQNTGEWFYDRVWEGLLPGFEPPMLAAFRRYLRSGSANLPSAEERKASGNGAFLNPIRQRNLIRFWRFQQEVMVEALEEFAHIIKEETEGRKLVVLFYGYLFELAGLPGGPAVSGHLAMERLLRCPNVDILCSPISYYDREPGGAGGFMAPVDSVHLHGKLWLNEDDTRTYLSKPEDNYGRAETLQATINVHRRNFAHLATRGGACWWMDLMGAGWLDSAEIWQNLAELVGVYEEILPDMKPYRPEIAVVVDEQSLCYLSYGNAITMPLLSLFRKQLYRIGAPVGLYLLSDVCTGAVDHAKLYLVLNAFAPSEAQRRALRDLPRQGKAVVWFYAPGYIRENTASADNITDLIGIRVAQRDQISPGRATTLPLRELAGKELFPIAPATRETFGSSEPLSPAFVVTDPAAHPVAIYDATDEVAMAIKRVDNGFSVFAGTLGIGRELLEAIARLAQVHIYSPVYKDVVMAGNQLLAVHACDKAPRSRSLNLPDPTTVRDLLTGTVEKMGLKTPEAKLDIGDTRIYRIL